MSELIDTTEMYLRTVYELLEEGVPPMRARIAERLRQSGPTVSQTVARMERDGLLRLDDRRIELSEQGYRLAEDVMRKHRLAERLLTDVIGLDLELVHEEACRWEHVISDSVERRLLQVLDAPTTSPYGNPIPGLERLGGAASAGGAAQEGLPLTELAPSEASVVLARMSEYVQADEEALAGLVAAGVVPGATITMRMGAMGVHLSGPRGDVEVSYNIADHLYGWLS